jgi:ATP phosphoribosyltransferase regulatory subunit
MPTHTPSFPDLLFEDAARLRRWETQLMDHLGRAGYRELHPSMVLRDPANPATVRFFDGDQLVALRWDFTESLARTLVRRYQDPPPRISYAGPVFRRPANSWDPVERMEVGCENIQVDRGQRTEADRELARLLMAVPGLLGLQGCLLHIGHAALLRRPLEAEAISPELGLEVARALDRRAIHRAAELLDGHPGRDRLLAHAEILLSGPNGAGSLADLARGPYGGLLEAEAEQLSRVLEALSAQLPEGLTLRLDMGDLRGLSYYTGPTLRLWAPGAQKELAAGGRYDKLFPEMGRPWYAAGFCVRLTTLLELAANEETQP